VPPTLFFNFVFSNPLIAGMMIKRLVAFFVLALLLACNSGPTTEPLELMKYGLPIQIKAPKDAVVKANDLGFYKDVTVKYEDNYFVQIISTSVTTTDLAALKNDQLREVRKNPFFKEIIFEEDNGFIFQKQIDSSFNYDFRYIKIQGSNEYIFQTGLTGTFTEEDVREMYESVK
jgi:hypothetical protein